jgi:hypothetical protein
MVEALKVQVAELTLRLGQNSQNASRPPSSDSPYLAGCDSDIGTPGIRPPRRTRSRWQTV